MSTLDQYQEMQSHGTEALGTVAHCTEVWYKGQWPMHDTSINYHMTKHYSVQGANFEQRMSVAQLEDC